MNENQLHFLISYSEPQNYSEYIYLYKLDFEQVIILTY